MTVGSVGEAGGEVLFRKLRVVGENGSMRRAGREPAQKVGYGDAPAADAGRPPRLPGSRVKRDWPFMRFWRFMVARLETIERDWAARKEPG